MNPSSVMKVAIVALLLSLTTVAAPYAANGEPLLVQLKHGALRSTRWAVFAQRDDGSGAARQPCLTAALGTRGKELSNRLQICGSLAAPLVVSNSSGVGPSERTVLGMAFARNTVSVRLWLRGRASRLIPMELLSRRQARATGLARFRYAALGIAGPFCLRRFAAYDRAGRLLFASPATSCRM